MKRSAAVPPVMLSHAGRVTKHLDFTMTYVGWRFFASLRMTKQGRFFTSAVLQRFTCHFSVPFFGFLAGTMRISTGVAISGRSSVFAKVKSSSWPPWSGLSTTAVQSW